MKLNLGQVTKRDTLPCGCLVNVRSNGYDTIDPCMGHAMREVGLKIERELRMMSTAMRDLRLKSEVHYHTHKRATSPGFIRRMWRRIF